jgi:hypothetical protein
LGGLGGRSAGCGRRETAVLRRRCDLGECGCFSGADPKLFRNGRTGQRLTRGIVPKQHRRAKTTKKNAQSHSEFYGGVHLHSLCIGTAFACFRAISSDPNRLSPSTFRSCRVWRTCRLCQSLG